MIGSERTRYDSVAMLIHWITAALMIFMIFFGEELMEAGEEAEEAGEALSGTFGPSLHVSIGVAILLLTLLRILWRVTHKAPPYPVTMKRYEVIGSAALHGLFYVLLIGLPITGWLAFGGFVAEEPAMAGVRVFSAFPLPEAPFSLPKGPHALGSNVAMVLTGLHILAALKHQFVDGDGLFRRMLPI